LLRDARGTQIKPKVYPPERDVKGEEPRIGIFVCHCGTNIGGVVNIPQVVEYVNTLPNVVYVENNLYTCSNDTQDRIKEKIAEHNLNRVVVASCTPRTHEPLFRNTLAEVRLSQPLYRQTVRVEKSALVIGGGLSGMTAALALASQGTETYLVEK